ncbi:MAG: hypothetical protein IJY27_04690 [Clostridia bacterium]|nr:hypothetical protein [Clostridia bacterium]
MKHEKMFKKDLAKIETPAIEKILPAASVQKAACSHAPRANKRLGAMAISVILCCCMVFGVAAATAVPMIVKIINDSRITENTQQLTVVPEGYVGIYTKEDLLAMSNRGDEKPATKYILMNDITFTDEDYAAGGICEGGIKPIELTHYYQMSNGETAVAHTSLGTFNGNGYVIRNLRLIPDERGYKCGLFGGVTTVINLGIENCEITVQRDGTGYKDLYVGAVSSAANFVGACYVDGLTVDIEYGMQDNTPESLWRYDIMIGGLCGQANYVDSCYVNNAQINVGGTGLDDSSDDAVTLMVGGVVGYCQSCITSWFSGEVNNSLEGKFYWTGTDNITVKDVSDSFPLIIDEETFEFIREKLLSKYGKDNFDYKKFCAYYLKKDIDALADNERALAELMTMLEQLNNMTGGKMDLENQHVWYIFDPTASHAERSEIYAILLNAFDGDKEALKQLCEYSYLNYGETCCYTLDLGKPLNSEDVTGFDFEKVWIFRDGKPVQQIFAD